MNDLVIKCGASLAIDKEHLNKVELASLKANCISPLKIYENNKPKEMSIPLYRENGDYIYLPRDFPADRFLSAGRGVVWENYSSDVILDEKVEQKVDFSKGSRIYQETAIQNICLKLLDSNKPVSGTILQAPCGSGKTWMSLEIARRLGRKTLVIIHKEFLGEQFQEAYNSVFGQGKLGTIQGGKIDCDSPVTVGMIQSLTSEKRDYTEIANSFGLVIIEECHRLSAQVWSEAAFIFNARFRLGITATPRRADLADAVFFRHIGQVGHAISREQTGQVAPVIYVNPLETSLSQKDAWVYVNGWPDPNRLMTWLAKQHSRNAKIADAVARAAAKGRRVLVLGHHHDQLDKIAEKSGIAAWGKLKAGQSKKAQEENKAKQILFATFSMAKEGLDVPDLDVLVFASPVSDCVQAVGRILRPIPGKPQPVVLDFVDYKVQSLNIRFNKRLEQYNEEGYEVIFPKNHVDKH